MPRSFGVTAESNLRFSHPELLHGCALRDSIADPTSDGRCTIRPAFTPKPHTTDEQLRAFLEFLGLNSLDSQTPLQAIEALGYEARVMRYARNRKLRDKVFRDADGVCEACEKDYSQVLGGKGERVLHVHHRFQLAFQKGFVVTSEDDLAVVCANCHSLLHIDPKKVMPVEILRDLLKNDKA